MFFFKARSKPASDMSDVELKEALDKAYLKASWRAQKREIVYGKYADAPEINVIKCAKITLKGGSRRLAVDFLTKNR